MKFSTAFFWRFVSLFSGSETAEKPSLDNWQDVVTRCLTGGFGTATTFKFNSSQCMDIAAYLEETAPFRQHAWELMRVVNCDRAIMEFCRSIVEAEYFLQAAADFNNAYNSLTKLETGEAYEVLLHNLIWSKAGLDLAILDSTNIDYEKEIRKRVEECNRMLSRYCTPASTKAHLDADRRQFYLSVENLQIRDESQKKCLTFVVGKSAKAYQGQDDGGSAQLLDAFKIDPHDLDGPEYVLAGEGASGLVYRRSWLGQNVAVKVFKGVPPDVFKQEASLLAGLQHPFIVQMVGWCIDENGTCMLVMEEAPTDLRKRIDRQPSNIISLPAAVDIMLQISKAMEYMHKRRIVHRDLKPNNVLLQPSSVKEIAAEGYARVKLCDFGIAKVKALSAADRSKYTTAKRGTSYYRAPEVLLDEDDPDSIKYTRKVDLFSFAITCSEILAGKTSPTCYENLSVRKMREKMLAGVRPDLPLNCPSHLASLISSCWQTHPDRRPPFSRVSNTLTYIKFILMRVTDVESRPYDSVKTSFDGEELKRRLSSAADGDYDDDTGRSSLSSGESLETHQCIMFSGYKLTMQHDGNLVLTSASTDEALWASNTRRMHWAQRYVCMLQDDGNLVICDSNHKHIVWSSNSSSRSGVCYKLELGDERALIRGPQGLIWATDESVERPRMKSGQFLAADQWMLCNGYKLIMQRDGILVVKSPNSSISSMPPNSSIPLWESKSTYSRHRDAPVYLGKRGRRDCRCTLRHDGTLVITTGDGEILWQSFACAITNYDGLHTLHLHRDGHLSITNHAGLGIWHAPRSPSEA